MIRSPTSGSPDAIDQRRAARRLCCSCPSRSIQRSTSGPTRYGPAVTARSRNASACRRSQSGRSPDASSRSRANSRSKVWRSNRGSPCSVWRTRTMLLSARASRPSTTSRPRPPVGSTTFWAISASHPPTNTASRRKIACSSSDSRSWLQEIAPRRVRWRSGRSRAPPASRSRLDSSRSRMATGPNTRVRAAASSMASGSPSRRLTMAPTAARSASVATASGRTSLARSTKSWIPAAASSGGTWYSYSPATRRTSRLVTITRRPGRGPQDLGDADGGPRQELLQVVEHEQGGQRLETFLERPGDRHARFLADVERRGDRARDQVRIADRGEIDEPCPAREPVRDRRREPEAEARLAGAAGSRQASGAASGQGCRAGSPGHRRGRRSSSAASAGWSARRSSATADRRRRHPG